MFLTVFNVELFRYGCAIACNGSTFVIENLWLEFSSKHDCVFFFSTVFPFFFIKSILQLTWKHGVQVVRGFNMLCLARGALLRVISTRFLPPLYSDKDIKHPKILKKADLTACKSKRHKLEGQTLFVMRARRHWERGTFSVLLSRIWWHIGMYFWDLRLLLAGWWSKTWVVL